ncbi:MAG: type IV pilus modification PilV family protein [Roseibacillus sp.]
MKIQDKRTKAQPHNCAGQRAGFSLIVTVTIMILLSLIAVGLLSLSTTTLRASTSTNAQTEARNNARLAAQLAISQLQGLSGLDTRITASAKLIDASNIDVAGVWRSWEGTNNGSDGKPIAPDYDSKTESGDASEALGEEGSGRFLGYLTSTSYGAAPNVSEVPKSSTSPGGNQVKLVSNGTIDTGDGVYLEPTLISSADSEVTGGISWWTSGDNSKALINVDPDHNPVDASDWQEQLRGNRLPDPEVFGLAELDEMTANDAILPSRNTLKLLNNTTPSGDDFYHRTTYNKGLLTNVATGGWRKDLSLFSEYYDRLPSSRLPLFSHLPGESLDFTRVTSRRQTSNALLYHWADYLPGNDKGSAWSKTPPICAWSALVNYMTYYDNLISSSPRSVTMRPQSYKVGGTSASERYNFQEQIRLHPQVTRIRWVLSQGSQEGENRGEYNPAIVLTPVVTVWNPYNVAISLSSYNVAVQRVFPIKMSFRVGTETYSDIQLNQIVNYKKQNGGLNLKLPAISLAPGENKVYSMRGRVPIANSGGQALTLSEGYEPAGGGALFVNFPDTNDRDGDNETGEAIPIVASSNDLFTISNIRFAAKGQEGTGNSDGIGIRFSASSNAASGGNIIVMAYEVDEFGGQGVIDEIYPPIELPRAVRLGDVTRSNARPFATANIGLRFACPPPNDDTRFKNTRTKGMLQANPLQHYAELGTGNDGNAIVNLAESGAYHTINAPYDFIISEASGWNDTLVSLDTDSSNRGFMVTGNYSDNGMTRAIVAELPTRPLQSLADLQHFDVRNNNQMPPFQFNLIGNSSAHPIFAPDQLSIDTRGDFAGLSNDDSYLLNHALFDDWFMSSIGPDLENFSKQEERPTTDVFSSFLEGQDDLPNWFYRPSNLAREQDTAELTTSYLSSSSDDDTGLLPFQSVAALLEVEGMFNINSVSVDAWRATLRRNRDLEVPYYSDQGAVDTDVADGTAFPRTTVAGDLATDSTSIIASSDNEVAILGGGYPAMSDSQIDALAEEIVAQVRKRGPFLSLSEFVNRQLSSDKDLALAGTIQRALDTIAENSSSERNPFLRLIEEGEQIDTTPPGITDYKFPEAAFGSTNFGVPGWVRQADILRSLAPIISARDDTFTIRAYGDSRDKSGAIVAQAWCEVVVQRQAEFVDNADAAQLNPHSAETESKVNRRFGRRYKQVSFRWLKEAEV